MDVVKQCGRLQKEALTRVVPPAVVLTVRLHAPMHINNE